MAEAKTVKFTVGEAFQCRSVCDHNCVWTYIVTKRTDKTITVCEMRDGRLAGTGPSMLRVTVHNNVETVKPLGSYSMAPILAADKKVGI